ncbi:type 1 glutamine amidotransferase domain-containing protein [Tropicimonas sediminicola]|uniref:Putative intracellular protease/amidase n=1 Tax=Tropicimonas sediminicola TaxID=1031541 RepID=A0A239L9X9_9RHOB|nr:type 1 glutamine amidotransferase domain-containing protein [Tropicimonas sediminicola]SNT26663.1 Putative intracellular protease/amidase [Tropicimonas sediminicola]
MKKILILSTAHADLGDTGNKTGVWMEELATPYYALKDGGHDVTVATIGGAPIPVDPNSEPKGDDAADSARRFADDPEAMAVLKRPQKLSDQSPQDFDAVFIPGGHGAVWDLASSDEVARFLSDTWAGGKLLASVCHGPAALVGVEAEGEPLVKGRKVSAFTDSEEEGTGLKDVVPFLLETRLRELGADFQPGPDWQPKAVADGGLITGQNPMSSEAVAKLLMEHLG